MGCNEAPETLVCSLRANIDLSVNTQAETGRAPHKLLCTLAGCHTEGVNLINFLVVNMDGLVSLLQSIFVVAGGEYEEETGDIWVVNGNLPDNRLPILVKLTPLHFSLIAAFWGIGQTYF